MIARPLLLAAALLATSVPALAAEEPAPGLREVFEAHEKAFSSHDLAGVMKLYAPGDRTVMLGTGPGERWIGSAQIEDAYRHFFADFDPGTLQRMCPWVLSDVSGDVGWLSATCEYHDSLKGAHRAYALNVSVVLQKMDGAWKLRTMHFSNLTPPQAK
jgi:ketosteroid isomerase-like protein